MLFDPVVVGNPTEVGVVVVDVPTAGVGESATFPSLPAPSDILGAKIVVVVDCAGAVGALADPTVVCVPETGVWDRLTGFWRPVCQTNTATNMTTPIATTMARILRF